MPDSNPPMHSRLGLIGLGLMGQAMAPRLLAHGFQVLGWDVRGEAGDALQKAGGMVCGSAGEVFEKCDRVILSLPDSQVVGGLLRELGGELRSGQVIVDTSTGSPEDAQTVADELWKAGVAYLDATVSGSSVQLGDGAAVCMVGGARDSFEGCADVFAALGGHTFYTGGTGSGAKMKLVTNLVLGLNRAALAEGLAFARALDLDLEATLEIMRGSMAYSRIMDTKGEKMIHSDFTPQARLSQHLKDVRLMLAATDTRLPLTEAHRTVLERAEDLGCGDLDNSALIRAYQADAAEKNGGGPML